MMNAKCALISERAAVLPDFSANFRFAFKFSGDGAWSLEFKERNGDGSMLGELRIFSV